MKDIINDILMSYADKYGQLSYSVGLSSNDYTSYSAKINKKFWEYVKTVADKNLLSVQDLIISSVAYRCHILDEGSQPNGDKENKVSELEKKISEHDDLLKELSTKTTMLTDLLSGRLA